ncbi:MAG: hypothetical protein M3O46_04030 [Myxococcota bacterium]|nr:hypothetical protein [Myxococcota bacterium]
MHTKTNLTRSIARHASGNELHALDRELHAPERDADALDTKPNANGRDACDVDRDVDRGCFEEKMKNRHPPRSWIAREGAGNRMALTLPLQSLRHPGPRV